MRGGSLAFLIGWLFYGNWLGGLLFIPILIMYLRNWQEVQYRRREREFRSQFRESLLLLSSALNVGYSVENAIRETTKEMRPIYKKESRIRKEYERMIHQMAMNRTVEQILEEFACRVDQEDVSDFVTVFVTAKRTGGDSIGIVKNTARDISDKIEVEEEIQTILAAKKLEFRIMCVIPLGIILYMRLAFPEFMRVLYGNLIGEALMTGCLGIYAAAYKIGKKMVEIEV